MKLQIEEAELRNLAHKASRYDIIMDALIREKVGKVDIDSDWENCSTTSSCIRWHKRCKKRICKCNSITKTQ